MPNRVKSHPSDGHIMRHVRGVQDDWYRIEPEDGRDGQWISAESDTYVPVSQ